MAAARTTSIGIIAVVVLSIGCGSRVAGGNAPAHKLTAVVIDSQCEDGKEDPVKVKKQGKVEWYVVSECGNYEGKLVSIQFVDDNDNEIPPPTDDGKCPKCSDKVKNNGFVKLWLMAKNLKDSSKSENYKYIVWIGDNANPHVTKLSDPRLEIDP